MNTTIQRPASSPPSPATSSGCGCGAKSQTRVQVRDCVPCDLDRFCRNNYFTGKLLTARDLLLEQRYARDKLRLHHRVMHGWGVVCGLKVKPHPYCPDRRLIVEPGVAVDACGYEIVVPTEVEIELPRPNPPPPKPGKPGSSAAQRSAYQQPPEPCEPSEPPIPLAVCIRYVECDEDFSPAPFDECGCNSSNHTQPNRVCEGFSIELRFEAPPRVERCPSGDCADLLDQAFDSCPAPSSGECLTLAYIDDFRPGETVVDARIDNRAYRQVLLSGRVLEQAVRCLIDSAPGTKMLTRVQDFNWTHAQEYNTHDFIHWFTGESAGGSAFTATFDSPVRSDAVSRVFEAAIVRQGDTGPAGPIEIAPSRVWMGDDGRVIYLQIDRSWAERVLRGARFDVRLTLRCNLIVDQNGLAVDGDLVARVVDSDRYLVAPPTGTGVPGGAMESWIGVRP